jgi:hypothetical protein
LRLEEIQGYSRQLHEKEASARKTRDKIDKARKAKDLLEQRIPTLESSICDMKELVEKFASEA